MKSKQWNKISMFCCIVGLLSTGSGLINEVVSQPLNSKKLDRYFDLLEKNEAFMGSVALSKNDSLLYSRILGYSDVATKEKAKPSTRYRIGSISKTFTAVMIFKAVEANLLSLDETLERYFPSIPNAQNITLRQLLHHRSGISNFTDSKDYLTWNTQPKSEDEMIQIISDAGSDFEPDSKAAYSNSNYVLLSYILEKMYKRSYGDLLHEQIVRPLGLTNTQFGEISEGLDRESKSYRYVTTWVEEPKTDPSIPMGAGGITSTVIDMVTFSNALFNGDLLSKESLERMKTMRDGYGMGVFTIPFYDMKGYGHTGGIDGFNAVFSHFSEDNIAFTLLSNGANFNTNEISIAVLSAAFGKEFELPSFQTHTVSMEILSQYVGEYNSEQLPIKISVTKEGNTLIAQATGQPALPLRAISDHIFKFDQAGAVFEFNPQKNIMILKQGGGQFVFTKGE